LKQNLTKAVITQLSDDYFDNLWSFIVFQFDFKPLPISSIEAKLTSHETQPFYPFLTVPSMATNVKIMSQIVFIVKFISIISLFISKRFKGL